ncbi:MAG TPA: hypothetical protein VLB45_03315 [Nitrosopumilaceae archaeon]|nr:hypothetical protein [Nitrosopumilaceae archaeon]
MSMIETTRDVKNNLLSRREITCTFKGLGGKLKKLEAIDMIAKQFKLEGKVIVPITLKNETGRPMVSGTFYVYDDEKLAKQHIKPAIFTRLEKAKGGGKTEEETKEAAPAEAKEAAPAKTKDAPAKAKEEAPAKTKEAPVEKKEEKSEKKPEEKKEKSK